MKSTRSAEVIVVGQGIVGTLVSYRLHQRGIEHLVVDAGVKRSSSWAAAGIINWITGKRFVKAWMTEELRPALQLYKGLGDHLGLSIIEPLLIYRDLSSPKDLNQWDLRRQDPDYAPYMGAPVHARQLDVDTQTLRLPSRLGPTLRGSRIDFRSAVTGHRNWLRKEAILIEQAGPLEELTRCDGWLRFMGLSAKHVIDCTGATARLNSLWQHLPWRGTLGEALRFERPEADRSFTAKRKFFYCPVGSEHDVWLGGTNADHFDQEEPSLRGQADLDSAATSFGVSLPDEAERLAAVRPTVRDRRPLLGQHPAIDGLWLCNGMGTKAASLAPYFTQHLLEHIFDDGPLLQDVDIARAVGEGV